MSSLLLQEVKTLLTQNIENVIFLNEYPETQANRVLKAATAVLGIVDEQYIIENQTKLSIDLYIPIKDGAQMAGKIFADICAVLKENMNDITGISRMKIKTDEKISAICLPCTISVENMQNTLTVNMQQIKAKSVNIVHQEPKRINPIGTKNSITILKSKINIQINSPQPYVFDEENIYEIVFAGTKYINCRMINAQFNERGRCKLVELEGVRE